MTEAQCLIDTLVSVLRRYHPAADDVEYRHWSDVDLFQRLHERLVQLNIDMAARGTSSAFWRKLELALRPVQKKKPPAWGELPKSIDDLCREPARGEFTGQAWEDIFEADEVFRDNKYKPQFDGKGVARRLESPHRARIERRSLDAD